MKLFLKKVCVFALIFALAAFAVCYAIDPYNVYHPLHYRENGVEPNKNYIKMKYILSRPDRFDTFIFGSSRAGYLNPQKLDGVKAYNMTYSMGTPQEHRDNLKTFLKNGIVPKNIILEVDDISYRMDPVPHREETIRCPYEYLTTHPLTFLKLYMCPVVALESLKISQYSDRNRTMEENFYACGTTIEYGQSREFAPGEQVDMSGPEYIDAAIEAVGEIAALCADNGIKLYVFVSPLHHATYTGALKRGDYYRFLRSLAEVTPFYNFSGYNDITRNDDCYLDYSHFRPEIGDRILDRIWNGEVDETLAKQGFGFYTDRDNIEQLIALLDKGKESFPTAED